MEKTECNVHEPVALYEDGPSYHVIEKAIHFLSNHVQEQPSLSVLSQHLGISEGHLQRMFTQWAGVSPKRFMQYLTKERAKHALRQSKSVLDTALDVGLSGPGRLHDLLVSCEAMTPGEIKALGAGLEVFHGYGDSPFGSAYVAWTGRGICHLIFSEGQSETHEQALFQRWSGACFTRDDQQAQGIINTVFTLKKGDKPVHLLLKGTNFQLKVWEALLQVERGALVSYSQVAKLIGSPNASRAVGSAVGANSLGFLIPCHRVIRETGEMGHYRWGIDRKAAILGWEAAQSDADD